MQFGLAHCNITPPFPVPMGGYANRYGMFDDVHTPLIYTAVVLEHEEKRLLIGAMDLLSFPNDFRREGWLRRLANAANCSADAVIMNASHTHGGPDIPRLAGLSIDSRTIGELDAIERYADWLIVQLEETTRGATSCMQPGTLWHAVGRTSLPMNRRLETNGQIINAPNPKGPIDDSMHILTIKDADNAPAATMMRVSCHPVATGAQRRITSDFVGAWRTAVNDLLDNTTVPIFLQGAAGDMRPAKVADFSDTTSPKWKTIPHDELHQIGQSLADEFIKVFKGGNFRQIKNPVPIAKRIQVPIPCEQRYKDAESVSQLSKSSNVLERKYAVMCRRRLEAGHKLNDHDAIDLQTVHLGSDLVIVTSNCEPLITIGEMVESTMSKSCTIFLGYTNGCTAYVPDTTEQARGGYEADEYLWAGLSGPYLPRVEKIISRALQHGEDAQANVQLRDNKRTWDLPRAAWQDRQEVTIVVCDSGLGGTGIAAELVESVSDTGAFEQVRLIYFDAKPASNLGYGDMQCMQRQARVLSRALRCMVDTLDADVIVMACNTFSALYKQTTFFDEPLASVFEIIRPSVNKLTNALKAQPDAHAVLFGTQTTVVSQLHRQLLIENGIAANRISHHACDELIQAIESGPESAATSRLVLTHVTSATAALPENQPIVASLNCTHFDYARKAFEAALEATYPDRWSIASPAKTLTANVLNTMRRNRFAHTHLTIEVVARASRDKTRTTPIASMIAQRSTELAKAIESPQVLPALFEID